MQHGVLRSFVDKETLIGYQRGNTYASTDVERVTFLDAEGYIKMNEKMKIDSLKKRASILKVKGYTKMTPKQLAAAVGEASNE